MENNRQTQDLLSRLVDVNNANLVKIIDQNDLLIALTYLGQGTADERVNTVTYSSASSGLPPVVLSFSYNVGAPYSVTSIQYS